MISPICMMSNITQGTHRVHGTLFNFTTFFRFSSKLTFKTRRQALAKGPCTHAICNNNLWQELVLDNLYLSSRRLHSHDAIFVSANFDAKLVPRFHDRGKGKQFEKVSKMASIAMFTCYVRLVGIVPKFYILVFKSETEA